MRNLIIFTFLLTLFSCKKEEFTPNPPNPPVDIITDSNLVDTTLTLAGQKWVITKISLPDVIMPENCQDTLDFENNSDYTYNNIPSLYDLDVNPYNYKLTLYNTPWGHLVGTLYEYNLTSGVVVGSFFVDYYNPSIQYKIWMTRQ
jgi:hypothetical protein